MALKKVADQHAVWETIAQSFDNTRNRTWEHVKNYLMKQTLGTQVLDLMAGNGRHTQLGMELGHQMTWSDWSRPAAKLIKQRTPQAHIVPADATNLPFRDDTYQACIYVAGLHGLPSKEQRHQSLKELYRILKPGGTAQITVWNRNAKLFKNQGTPNEPLETIVPWKGDGKYEERYYYLYTPQQLAKEVEQAGFEIQKCYETSHTNNTDPDNVVIEVRKTT